MQSIYTFQVISNLLKLINSRSFKNYSEIWKTAFLEKLGFFKRIPEQLSLHFSDFSTIYYLIYKIQVFEPKV
jgi:hypothetical protein